MKPHIDEKKLAKTGAHHNLRFIVLHGSFADNTDRADSDVDIAVVLSKPMSTEELLQLHMDITAGIDESTHDIDIKVLNGADPLFRYEVTRKGLLLYGDPADYEEYKAISYRMYEDTAPLRELEALLIKRRQERLNAYAQ